MPEDYTPEWSNNRNWTEYDWEMAMRQSDEFASKYFDLLQKYGELPGSDDIILQKLDGKTPVLMDDGDYYVEFDPEEMAEIDDDSEEDFSLGLYYENHASFMLLRQVSIGWCNIYATFLLPEHRKHGVTILFHLGRALAHLIGSLGDGNYEVPASHLASAKRALDQVNKAIGLVDQLTKLRPAYKKVTTAINKHLTEIQGKIVDLVYQLKEKCTENQ
ncbi:MAG: hypothetical protein NE334_06305 [Lentisphaeraceae bacterium]|nr:hypothetical protein [Lentisphaeraceae bacterium]